MPEHGFQRLTRRIALDNVVHGLFQFLIADGDLTFRSRLQEQLAAYHVLHGLLAKLWQNLAQMVGGNLARIASLHVAGFAFQFGKGQGLAVHGHDRGRDRLAGRHGRRSVGGADRRRHGGA